MMRDPDDKDAIRQDLQRYRDILKGGTLEAGARRALRQLVNEAENRLTELEEYAEAT